MALERNINCNSGQKTRKHPHIALRNILHYDRNTKILVFVHGGNVAQKHQLITAAESNEVL